MTSPAASIVELRAGALRLALRPDLGGCVAGLWLGGEPVLRSVEPATLRHVGDSASFPLVPYSNRLGHRHFDWLGQRYTTAANFPNMPHSLHGMAWQRAWRVVSSAADEAVLTLKHAPDADWPFAFEAQQRFMLTPEALRVELQVRNDAPDVAPMGLGWHPYFPKRAGSHLQVDVRERWQADAAMLPTHCVALPGLDADVAGLDLDHGFEGWQGPACIRDEKLSLQLRSSLDRLVIYTPPHEPFFAVEPVSHATNAIQHAEPLHRGLRAVASGAATSAWMALHIAPA